MNLVSSISYYVPKAYDYAKRLVKASPYIIFEEAGVAGAKKALAVTKAADESILSVLKKAIKAGGLGIEESIVKTKKAAKGGFLKVTLKSLKELPSVIKVSTKWSAAKAVVTAKAAGKSGFATRLAGIWGGTKGFFKGIGKKMPLIGNILLVAFELPNIVKATSEKGIGQGAVEVVKAGTRLTAASIASGIGTAMFGPIGGIAGFIIGDWVTSKIIGKSYTEKVAEEEQKNADAIKRVQNMGIQVQTPQTVQQPSFAGNYTPMSNPFSTGYDNFSNSYSNDLMMKNVNFSAMV